MRNIEATYEDPLAVIWSYAANALAIEIQRDSEVFASWNGEGVLRIGTPETLDPDDSLGQMIFHEICHALTEGIRGLSKQDWGLKNEPGHVVREHACLRLQASLADRYGLRQFFATTTEFRAYYDSLPEDPLQGDEDPAIGIAREALDRASQGLWSEVLHEALWRTSELAALIAPLASSESLWSTFRALGGEGSARKV